MVNDDELFHVLEKITEMQPTQGFILSGFYLTPNDLALIKPVLNNNDPLEGSEGRYLGVPVYPADIFPNGENSGILSQVQFTYVRMGVVN